MGTVARRCHPDLGASEEKQHMATVSDLTDDECWQITRHPTVKGRGHLLQTGSSATVEIKLKRGGFTISKSISEI